MHIIPTEHFVVNMLFFLDICQIRLDFTTFVIAGPANSLENIVAGTQNHNCLNDKITIVVSIHNLCIYELTIL